MGTVAAVFLAGFCLTILGQITWRPESDIPMRNWAVFFFLAAALSFLFTVVSTYHAHSYMATSSQIESWWPDKDKDYRARQLEVEQKWHADGVKMWGRRARRAYNLALFFLLVALPLLLIPPGPLWPLCKIPFARLITLLLASFACLTQATWSLFRRKNWLKSILQPPDPPEHLETPET
jgi:hypothetical protein